MTAPSLVLGFLVRVTAAVMVVALLLFLGGPAREFLMPGISAARNLGEFTAQIKRAGQFVDEEAIKVNLRLDKLRNLPAKAVNARLNEVDAEITKLSGEPKLQGISYLALARVFSQGNLEAALKNEARKGFLVQERDALQRIGFYVRLISDRKSLEEEVRRLDTVRDKAKKDEVAAEKIYRQYEQQASCLFPLSACFAAMEAAHKKWIEVNREAHRTYHQWKQQYDFLKNRDPAETVPLVRVDPAGARATLDDMVRQVAHIESWGISTLQPALNAFYAAFQIVGAALAIGLGLKIFFFFVLAPLAQHRPALIIRRAPGLTAGKPATKSDLSCQVSLSSRDELVTIGSHLQSLTDGARTRTKWLFSTSHPLSSLLCGLWMMTRVRTRSSCTAVLSATTDALEELNSVHLDEREGLVLQPKHLVGVVHPLNRQVRLRSYWKFGIHAWLTLQFRYLVIEGPCQVIVGGCRGVRVENADGGRTVSQAMIVGFSAHLAYSVTRTETFAAYLIGQRPLFNDRLHGPGVVLFQEVPSTAQRAGFTGRGLQGVIDGAMKAFGL